MKFVDEYRDREIIENLFRKIESIVTREWNIMEICGGQTHAILKYNLEEFLPDKIKLIHGPGCPVCVTPAGSIDTAIAAANEKNVLLASFGDMLRVPGSREDLLSARGNGAGVKMIYSPLDAVKMAGDDRSKRVVFFAVGFETTAPSTAAAVRYAYDKRLDNFFIICAHVLVPPALEALLSSDNNRIDAVLAAGHVCAVTGMNDYLRLSANYKIPIVATGFEPADILYGIYLAVKQLERGTSDVEIPYSRAVKKEGNLKSVELINSVFEVTDREWRGLGVIPDSGLKLKEQFSRFDAEKIFQLSTIKSGADNGCIAGEILSGIKKPFDCPKFAVECRPEKPLGAPMVSSEGVCAAYFRYKK